MIGDFIQVSLGYLQEMPSTLPVMIRFIEEESRKLFYKSGGGITIDSSLESEYQELIDKIYIPV